MFPTQDELTVKEFHYLRGIINAVARGEQPSEYMVQEAVDINHTTRYNRVYRASTQYCLIATAEWLKKNNAVPLTEAFLRARFQCSSLGFSNYRFYLNRMMERYREYEKELAAIEERRRIPNDIYWEGAIEHLAHFHQSESWISLMKTDVFSYRFPNEQARLRFQIIRALAEGRYCTRESLAEDLEITEAIIQRTLLDCLHAWEQPESYGRYFRLTTDCFAKPSQHAVFHLSLANVGVRDADGYPALVLDGRYHFHGAIRRLEQYFGELYTTLHVPQTF